MALQKLTQIEIKNTEHNVLVQNRLFELGYQWGGGIDLIDFSFAKPVWIFMNKGGRLTWSLKEKKDLVVTLLEELVVQPEMQPDVYTSLTSNTDVPIDWDNELIFIHDEPVQFQAIQDLVDFINKHK